MAYEECVRQGKKPGDTIMIDGESYLCPSKPAKIKKKSNQTGVKPSGTPMKRGYGGF